MFFASKQLLITRKYDVKPSWGAVVASDYWKILWWNTVASYVKICGKQKTDILYLLLWSKHHSIMVLLDLSARRQHCGVLTSPSLTSQHLLLLRIIRGSVKNNPDWFQSSHSSPLLGFCPHGSASPEPNWSSNFCRKGWQKSFLTPLLMCVGRARCAVNTPSINITVSDFKQPNPPQLWWHVEQPETIYLLFLTQNFV